MAVLVKMPKVTHDFFIDTCAREPIKFQEFANFRRTATKLWQKEEQSVKAYLVKKSF